MCVLRVVCKKIKINISLTRRQRACASARACALHRSVFKMRMSSRQSAGRRSAYSCVNTAFRMCITVWFCSRTRTHTHTHACTVICLCARRGASDDLCAHNSSALCVPGARRQVENVIMLCIGRLPPANEHTHTNSYTHTRTRTPDRIDRTRSIVKFMIELACRTERTIWYGAPVQAYSVNFDATDVDRNACGQSA